MSALRFVMTYQALRLIGGAALVAAVFAVNVSDAKKPPKDPPTFPDPPVQYCVNWLPNLAENVDDSDAYDINRDGLIVGRSDGRAVCWIPLSPVEGGVGMDYAVIDLNLFFVGNIPPGLHLYSANRITNSGLIAGRYIDDTNNSRGLFVCNMTTDPPFFHHSAPGVVDGGLWVLGLNNHGTVVGYVSFPGSHFDTYVGFVWNTTPHELPVKLLPEPFIPTSINDDGTVVGKADGRSYDYGVFSWLLDFDTPNNIVDEYSLIGPATQGYPGPQINNDGDISANINWIWTSRKDQGLSVSLLPSDEGEWDLSDGTEWDRLSKEHSARNAMNDDKQVACGLLGDYGPYGAVIVAGEVWRLDNPKIIVDGTNQWFEDYSYLEAVADVSDKTVGGFSPVVGVHYNGQAFLLMPENKP